MVYQPQIISFHGPHRAGKNDRDVFREKLKTKMARTAGKMGIADGGYEMSKEDDVGYLCVPNSMDSKELRKFKSRARCRHESLNGRLTFFSILQNTFRHGMEKHKVAFEAVCVILQYQMNNGAPIFDA